MGSGRNQLLTIGQFVRLFGEGSFAPINPAIASKIRPMQIIGAARDRTAIVPDLTFFVDSVRVAVSEFQNMGRCRNISVVPNAKHP